MTLFAIIDFMIRAIFLSILFLLVGIGMGAYLFSGTQSRSVLRLQECRQDCLSSQEALGLLASVGIQKIGSALPFIVKETDKTLAIRHPAPRADVHYVIIPKQDIKNPHDVTQEDAPYLADAFVVMRELIEEQGLEDYKIVANGPGFQTVQYLHFHLVSDLPE